MKYNRYLKTGTIVFISLFLVSTASAWLDRAETALPDIPQEWTIIDPEKVYPDFEYNGYTPSCAACPPLSIKIPGRRSLMIPSSLSL